MRVNFNEVVVIGRRVWRENGRRRQQTKKFWQTINPFNKNADGTQKSRDQIVDELRAERDAWLAQNGQAGMER